VLLTGLRGRVVHGAKRAAAGGVMGDWVSPLLCRDGNMIGGLSPKDVIRSGNQPRRDRLRALQARCLRHYEGVRGRVAQDEEKRWRHLTPDNPSSERQGTGRF